MATEIKAIQCPKCGSPQKTEVRPGVFRCDSCGTEYFLDNDDININVRQVPATPAPAPAPAPVVPGQGRSVSGLRLLGLLGLLVVVVYGYLKSRGEGDQATSTAAAVATERWQWDSPQTALFSRGSGQQPVLLVAGKRANEDLSGSQAGVDSVGFYNAATGTRLKLVGLPGSDPAGGLSLRQFSNGTVFLLLGTMTVYRVDAQTLTVEDVSKTLFQDQPALASGVASIGTGNNEDDSFYLFTNDGHHYNYYPLIHQLYTNDEQGEAKYGFKSLRPGSTRQTGFAFSRASGTDDDLIQLITYEYRDNGGGPKAPPFFEWEDDYGGSGIFTDADPHVRRLITPYWVQLDRLTGYHDLTPGRPYFSPHLLYYDTDCVLISVQPTAADNSPVNLQALDAHTGAIRFTIPLPGGLGRSANVLRYPAGLVINNGLTTYTLSPHGQLGPPVSIQ